MHDDCERMNAMSADDIADLARQFIHAKLASQAAAEALVRARAAMDHAEHAKVAAKENMLKATGAGVEDPSSPVVRAIVQDAAAKESAFARAKATVGQASADAEAKAAKVETIWELLVGVS